MKNFKIYSTIFLVLAHIISQSSVLASNAYDILKKQSDKIPFSVEFEQSKFLNEFSVELKSTGKLDVQDKNTITWSTITPSPMKVKITESNFSITTYKNGKKDSEKNFAISENKKFKSLLIIKSLMTLNLKRLKEIFDISYSDSKVTLNSIDTNTSPFLKAVMSFDKNHNLKKIKIFEKTKDSITIIFKNLIPYKLKK